MSQLPFSQRPRLHGLTSSEVGLSDLGPGVNRFQVNLLLVKNTPQTPFTFGSLPVGYLGMSARKLGISPVTGHRREKAKVTGRKGEKVRGRWTRRQSTSARKLGISPVTRHRREKVKMTGRKGKKVRQVDRRQRQARLWRTRGWGVRCDHRRPCLCLPD